ncbi:MAG: sugar phosphate isomerase/epimerase [Candidatus Saccharibacteria bacterium]|nr:sugar phosphate isomerase/epimerase [Candidatus Saccharibacteria bacterium]
MHKLGINFDEISDDINTALRVMDDEGVKFGELRTLNQKNFVFWSDQEVDDFKKSMLATDVKVIAAATPLFKWYINPSDPDVEHDSFGFNPRLSDDEKVETIKRTIHIAAQLGIPRLRIFSGLGSSDNVVQDFAESPLLKLALSLAQQNNIDLYLENEPVCIACRKDQILEVFSSNKHPNFKFWLDIANLVELNEEIDDAFLSLLAERIGYIHVKDYRMDNGEKHYLPVGEGTINYPDILSHVFNATKNALIITVETHAKEDKVGASIKSIRGTKVALDIIGADYE